MRSSASTTVTSEPDIARAHDDELLRQRIERKRFGRGNHVAAERQKRQLDRQGAVGEDHMLGRHRHRPIFALDGAGFRIGEIRPAVDDPDLRALEQGYHAGVELADDTFLPADELGHVEGRCRRERDAVASRAGRGMRHRLELARDMNERLGGNAAPNEAGATQRVAFDDRRV
jgi:hypothetical protein